MTKRDLLQYRYIIKEIEQWREELCWVQQSRLIPDQKISSQPRSARTKEPPLERYISIEEIEETIQTKIKELDEEHCRIIKFIDGIDDSRTRMIFYFRYIKLYSWSKVAKAVGVGYTSDGVRKIHNRYLSKMNKKDR